MNKKQIGVCLSLLLASPLHAMHNDPYANNHGPSETKKDFVPRIESAFEQGKERAAIGDPNAYKNLENALHGGYKHSWLMKNPGKAFLYFVGGTAAVITLLIVLSNRG